MKDPVIEARLDREGVEYEYREELPLTEVDVTASLRNQARFEPIDRPSVERYALAMIDGAPFPAVIVHRPDPKGRFVVVDGNHRVAAATEAERPALDAYVLLTPDHLTVTRMTRTWNIGNGRQPSKDEIVEQALYLVKNTPYTQAEVAKMVGMKTSTLSAHVRSRDTRERLYRAGVPAEALQWSALDMLAALDDDAVLAEAARLAVRASMSTPKLQQLVTDVRRGKSEDERLGIIKTWATRTRTATALGAGGRYPTAARRTHVTKLLSALHTVSHLCGRNPSAAQFGLVLKEDVETVRGAYTEATNRLRRLLDSAAGATGEV